MMGKECGHRQSAREDGSPCNQTANRGDDTHGPAAEIVPVKDSIDEIELGKKGVGADPCLTVKRDVDDPANGSDGREPGESAARCGGAARDAGRQR